MIHALTHTDQPSQTYVLAPDEVRRKPTAWPGIKADSTDTVGPYSVFEDTLAPWQSGPPLHLHSDEDEAFYVLEGTLTVKLDGEQREVTAGSFVWIPRGTHTRLPMRAAAPSSSSASQSLFASRTYLRSSTGISTSSRVRQIWPHSSGLALAAGVDCWVRPSRLLVRPRESPDLTPVDLVLSISGLLVGAVLCGWLATRAWRVCRAVLRWLGAGVLALGTVVLALVAILALIGVNRFERLSSVPAATLQVAASPDRLARGQHLANLCSGCHATTTQKLPLDGGNQNFLGPLATLYAPNLTPAGPLAGWSDRDIVRAVRDGVAPDG
jgi:mannose-6-phosphate isomerase-like protein (cupin superfamily)